MSFRIGQPSDAKPQTNKRPRAKPILDYAVKMQNLFFEDGSHLPEQTERIYNIGIYQ